jgi:hypothetical protein
MNIIGQAMKQKNTHAEIIGIAVATMLYLERIMITCRLQHVLLLFLHHRARL